MLVFGINFILIKMFMGIRGNCKQMDESAFYRRCCIAVTKNAARLFIENDAFSVTVSNYIQGVLKYALEIGNELSKPVYPYIWYLLDPSNNKVTGGEILSFELMDFYLSTIKNYRYNDNGVDGVIWWESSDNGRKRIIKNNPENIKLRITDSIDKYLYEFTKNLQ